MFKRNYTLKILKKRRVPGFTPRYSSSIWHKSWRIYAIFHPLFYFRVDKPKLFKNIKSFKFLLIKKMLYLFVCFLNEFNFMQSKQSLELYRNAPCVKSDMDINSNEILLNKKKAIGRNWIFYVFCNFAYQRYVCNVCKSSVLIN